MSRTRLQPRKDEKGRRSDAIRVLLALVFILFASLASRDHETPETVLESQEVAQANIKAETKHEHESESKRWFRFADILSRINGLI